MKKFQSAPCFIEMSPDCDFSTTCQFSSSDNSWKVIEKASLLTERVGLLISDPLPIFKAPVFVRYLFWTSLDSFLRLCVFNLVSGQILNCTGPLNSFDTSPGQNCRVDVYNEPAAVSLRIINIFCKMKILLILKFVFIADVSNGFVIIDDFEYHKNSEKTEEGMENIYF